MVLALYVGFSRLNHLRFVAHDAGMGGGQREAEFHHLGHRYDRAHALWPDGGRKSYDPKSKGKSHQPILLPRAPREEPVDPTQIS